MNSQFKSALLFLRKARIDRGYTQSEAAEIMGMPNTIQLSRWESGARLPSLINALMLSAAYNSNVDYLFNGISGPLRKEITKRRVVVDERKHTAELKEKFGSNDQTSPTSI